MPLVRIEHSVPDFDRWKKAFDSDPADRKGSGVRRYEIFRSQEDPNFVLIDLELDSLEQCQAFLRTMQRIWTGPGGSVMRNPQARIVERVESRAL
jgi:hypothetical protein